MCDRVQLINAFLQDSKWAKWKRTPLAGDASGRRYERLNDGSDTVILMDAPPQNGESTRPFAAIATFLASTGLCPPTLLAHDPSLGVMVLSDLGTDDYATWLQQRPDDASMLYRAATDVLVKLHKVRPPGDLVVMTPDVGAQMVNITSEYYAQSDSPLYVEMQEALETLTTPPNIMGLRDYHAENLIWRPRKTGCARVGLLDFQDAFVAPAGYDLASLLRDARRDVDQGLADEMITYFTEKTGLAQVPFRAQLACLGAQRNLRILGVFARLAQVKGKQGYIDLIPRVWDNLMIDLAHPGLTKLRQAVDDLLPVPDAETLARLRST